MIASSRSRRGASKRTPKPKQTSKRASRRSPTKRRSTPRRAPRRRPPAVRTHRIASHRTRPRSALGSRVSHRERLTVLMVGWEFPPFHTGGLGVHSYEISKEIARSGHRVLFATPFDRPYTKTPGVEFLSEGVSPTSKAGESGGGAYDLGDFFGEGMRAFMDHYNDWVARLSSMGPIDVVHVHDWFGTVGGRALAQRLGAALVMTVHSTGARSVARPPAHSDLRARVDRGPQRRPGDRREPPSCGPAGP